MTKKNFFFMMGLTASTVLSNVSAEVIPGTDFSVHFESGHLVGSGRHLNMTQVPVIDINSGKRTLYDVSFKFTFIPDQGLIFDQISSAAISPPVSVATNIIPGVYRSQGSYCYKLEGPTMLNANRSVYTFRSFFLEGCHNASSFSAQIVSGIATDHPDIGAREIVPNLQNDYVYGYIATKGNWPREIGAEWEQNELLGIRQSGEQLIVGLFSDGVDSNNLPNDFKRPVKTVILTKIGD